MLLWAFLVTYPVFKEMNELSFLLPAQLIGNKSCAHPSIDNSSTLFSFPHRKVTDVPVSTLTLNLPEREKYMIYPQSFGSIARTLETNTI